MTIEVGADNFEQEVLKSDKPVLVDFWAPWCGPCRTMGPIVDSLAADRADTMKVVKLNVDEHKAIAEEYGVKGLPSFLMFRDGKVTDSLVAAKKKQDFYDWADKAAALPAEGGKTAAEAKADLAAKEKEAEEKFMKAFAGPIGGVAAALGSINHLLTIAGGVLVATLVPGALPLALGALAVGAGLYRLGFTVKKGIDLVKNPETALKKHESEAAERKGWSTGRKLLVSGAKLALGAGVLGAGIYLFGIAAAATGVAATVGAALLGVKMAVGGTGSVVAHGGVISLTALAAGLKGAKKSAPAKEQASKPIVVAPVAAPAPAVAGAEAQKSFEAASRPADATPEAPVVAKTPEIKPPAPPQA